MVFVDSVSYSMERMSQRPSANDSKIVHYLRRAVQLKP